jgi:hypothetical protein
MIKNKKFLAGAALLSAVAFTLAFGPVSHGGNPFPPDDNGGNIVAHGGNPFPPDDNGGNIVAHGGNPFPPDDNGGNIVA